MKYCTHCGYELLDEAVVCPHCGYWIDAKAQETSVANPKPKLNVLSLVGFILSMVSVVMLLLSLTMQSEFNVWVCFFSLPFAIPGVVCSIVGLVKTVRRKQRGKGFAIAGIVVGGSIIEFLLAILVLALIVVYVGFIAILLLFLLMLGAGFY